MVERKQYNNWKLTKNQNKEKTWTNTNTKAKIGIVQDIDGIKGYEMFFWWLWIEFPKKENQKEILLKIRQFNSEPKDSKKTRDEINRKMKNSQINLAKTIMKKFNNLNNSEMIKEAKIIAKQNKEKRLS